MSLEQVEFYRTLVAASSVVLEVEREVVCKATQHEKSGHGSGVSDAYSCNLILYTMWFLPFAVEGCV